MSDLLHKMKDIITPDKHERSSRSTNTGLQDSSTANSTNAGLQDSRMANTEDPHIYTDPGNQTAPNRVIGGKFQSSDAYGSGNPYSTGTNTGVYSSGLGSSNKTTSFDRHGSNIDSGVDNYARHQDFASNTPADSLFSNRTTTSDRYGSNNDSGVENYSRHQNFASNTPADGVFITPGSGQTQQTSGPYDSNIPADSSFITPGSGHAEKTGGPHNSNILNKLDPRVDSNPDPSTHRQNLNGDAHIDGR